MIANAPVYVHNERGHLVFIPEGEEIPEFCAEQIDHPDVLPSEEEAPQSESPEEEEAPQSESPEEEEAPQGESDEGDKKPVKRSSRSSAKS